MTRVLRLARAHPALAVTGVAVFLFGFAALAAARQPVEPGFLKIGLAAALMGGLIDGINPSAFATLIFLIGYLATLQRPGKDILVVGSAFSAGFFLAYLGIGISLSELLLQLEFLPKVAVAINWGIIVLAFVLGTLSLLDFYRACRGRAEEMPPKIPSPIRRAMNLMIARRLRTSHVALAAFGLGVFIAAVEFISTGQLYPPMIQFMNSISARRAEVRCLLLVYNLACILPLVAIFLFAYWGVGTEKLNGLMHRQIPLMKLVMAMFFFGLGVALIVFG